MTFEIEQKFRVDDVIRLEQRLAELDAVADAVQEHGDSYYNHPCRDFRETREALRIRRVDGIPLITYKGPKLPGAIKARREQEWRLDPGDIDGTRTEDLLRILGFRPVAVVRKKRRPYRLRDPWSDFQVVLDDVQRLGWFAEVELVVESELEIEPARRRVRELSAHLGLQMDEPRSYLSMLMELPPG